MKKSVSLFMLLLLMVLLISCPTEEDVINEKKREGIDLLEEYSTIEYYDSGKGETVSVPMEFEYVVGIDSPGHKQRIKLSRQELDNPNKSFLVTVKAKLSEGLKGFTVFFGQPEANKVNFTVVGEKEVIKDKDWYWSKEEDGFAVIQFELKPEWLNCVILCWKTDEDHYLNNNSTRWVCYVEEE